MYTQYLNSRKKSPFTEIISKQESHSPAITGIDFFNCFKRMELGHIKLSDPRDLPCTELEQIHTQAKTTSSSPSGSSLCDSLSDESYNAGEGPCERQPTFDLHSPGSVHKR